jgi:hypothetical protein
MRTHSLIAMALMWTMATGSAQAQESAPASGGPATISGTGGFTTGMHGTGPVLGGAVTLDLNDWFAVEGTGAYFNRGSGADAISTNASLLVNVLPSSRKTVPYFAIGGGVYRASFDLGNNRFFGVMAQQFGPGTQVVPVRGMAGFGMMSGAYNGPAVWEGRWEGATFTSPHMPAFYANRMGIMTVPANGNWGMRSFTDPALVVGGGVRLGLTPHLAVRPDFRAITVFGGGHMNTLGTFSLNLGYRF